MIKFIFVNFVTRLQRGRWVIVPFVGSLVLHVFVASPIPVAHLDIRTVGTL